MGITGPWLVSGDWPVLAGLGSSWGNQLDFWLNGDFRPNIAASRLSSFSGFFFYTDTYAPAGGARHRDRTIPADSYTITKKNVEWTPRKTREV